MLDSTFNHELLYLRIVCWTTTSLLAITHAIIFRSHERFNAKRARNYRKKWKKLVFSKCYKLNVPPTGPESGWPNWYNKLTCMCHGQGLHWMVPKFLVSMLDPWGFIPDPTFRVIQDPFPENYCKYCKSLTNIIWFLNFSTEICVYQKPNRLALEYTVNMQKLNKVFIAKSRIRSWTKIRPG